MSRLLKNLERQKAQTIISEFNKYPPDSAELHSQTDFNRAVDAATVLLTAADILQQEPVDTSLRNICEHLIKKESQVISTFNLTTGRFD